jgi:hypothetical protein
VPRAPHLFGDRVRDVLRGPGTERLGGFIFRSAQVSDDGRCALITGHYRVIAHYRPEYRVCLLLVATPRERLRNGLQHV